MFKLKPIPSTLPLPIREEWDRLQQLQNTFLEEMKEILPKQEEMAKRLMIFEEI